MCAYHCAQLSYTTQHRTVLIIFPPIVWTNIIAQMLSAGGSGKCDFRYEVSVQIWTPHVHVKFRLKISRVAGVHIILSMYIHTTQRVAQTSGRRYPVKTSHCQNVPQSKRPHSQNVPSQNVPLLKQNVPVGQNVPSQNVPMLMN